MQKGSFWYNGMIKSIYCSCPNVSMSMSVCVCDCVCVCLLWAVLSNPFQIRDSLMCLFPRPCPLRLDAQVKVATFATPEERIFTESIDRLWARLFANTPQEI